MEILKGVLNPREAGRYITENSSDVFIEDKGVKHLANIDIAVNTSTAVADVLASLRSVVCHCFLNDGSHTITLKPSVRRYAAKSVAAVFRAQLHDRVKIGDFDVTMWRRHELNPQTMDEDAVNWVFVSAVLNFSFWSEKETEKYKVKYKGNEYTGYWALCAAMNRALTHLKGCNDLLGSHGEIVEEAIHDDHKNMTMEMSAAAVEGCELTNPSFYASVDSDTLKKIFHSDSAYNIPMLDERGKVLREAGKVLLEKFHGKFVNVIKQADKSAQNLLKLVVQNFPSFQDVAEFKGKKDNQMMVCPTFGTTHGFCHPNVLSVTLPDDNIVKEVPLFRARVHLQCPISHGKTENCVGNQEIVFCTVGIYKRAQILIGDIWGCCEGQGLGEFYDFDTITMFADYRIPQALVYFGVIRYSENLMNKLKQAYLFQSGEQLEVEIRGVSLWACELVRDHILHLHEADINPKKGKTSICAILVDHYLWDIRREIAEKMEDIPFHRCRGIYY